MLHAASRIVSHVPAAPMPMFGFARLQRLLKPFHASRLYSVQSASAPTEFNSRTIPDIQAMKGNEAISMITAYDAPSARIAASGGMDIILVGDSVAQVVHGHDSTVPATMTMMELHCQAVRRGLGRQGPLVVGDLPFGSYVTVDKAVNSSLQLIKEGGADAVKLEGGLYTTHVVDQVKAVVQAGMPVMGHVGLTPQTAATLGGYKVQGQSAEPALRLVEEALALEQAGVFSIVAEMVPTALAQTIAQEVSVPVIGIGAGLEVDGQVLVYHDVTGMFEAFRPRFMKEYVSGGDIFRQGIRAYNAEVKERAFPVKGTHDFRIKSDVIAQVRAAVPALRQRMALGQGSKRQLSTTAVAHRSTTVGPAATPTPSIAVIGGGAMGSLLTARLSLRSCEAPLVNMVTGWAEQIQALSHNGLELVDSTSSATSTTTFVPATSLNVINGLHERRLEALGGVDLVLVLVKSSSTTGAAQVAKRLLKADGSTLVLTLQNGLGNAELLAHHLSNSTVLPGVTMAGAMLERPGRVVHTGLGQTFVACESKDAAVMAQAQQAVDLLNDIGMQATLVQEPNAMKSVVWSKLLINAAINPVTALLNVPNGDVLGHPDALALMEEVVEEGQDVASRLNISLTVSNMSQAVRDVLSSTAPNTSSMLADVRRGVATEIQAINGQIVTYGQSVGINTPLNRQLVSSVTALERFPQQRSAFEPQLLLKRRYSTHTTPTVLRTEAELRAWRQASPDTTLGFVPTMGALHAGHLGLVDAAVHECDRAVASIFVNPAQFAAHEDLDSYPQTLDHDIAQLAERKIDAVFVPSRELMYPPHHRNVKITMTQATKGLEGASRPSFFDGVALICAKLFNLVQPSHAYFGLKDAQQCVTIRQLIDELNYPIALRLGATVRHEDGLAMSSRNLRLSDSHRAKANVLYRALCDAQQVVLTAGGTITAGQVVALAQATMATEPEFQTDYVTVSRASDMIPLAEDVNLLEVLETDQVCISNAGWFGDVRLIDNLLVAKKVHLP
eukprot:m.266101 g.266101  ORF g.266101 m.266101 type:complete len:1011 (-) comp17626_c0_seq7:1850-4882(-)